MKKTSSFILGFALGALLFGGATAYAAGILAQPKTAAVVIDGKAVDLKGYLIEGSHYFQLRDLATALKSGGKDFSIVWDGPGNRIVIDTRRGYDPNELYIPPPTSTPTPAPTPAPAVPARNPGTPAGVLDKDLAIWQDSNYTLFDNELEAIRLINEERKAAGLSPVKINLDLCKVARIKAEEMVALNYCAHESPCYGLPKAMLKTFGIPNKGVCENVSFMGGSIASSIVWNWMHSDGHRYNLLFPKNIEIGIGMAHNGKGYTYWSVIMIQ